MDMFKCLSCLKKINYSKHDDEKQNSVTQNNKENKNNKIKEEKNIDSNENVVNTPSESKENKNPIISKDKNTINHIMQGMQEFFDKRDECGGSEEKKNKKKIGRGDYLNISNKNGPINIHENDNFYSIDQDNKENILKFINYVCEYFEWNFQKDDWTFDNLKMLKFEKDSLNSSGDSNKKNLTKKNVKDIYMKKIFSSAQTGGSTLEFTYLGDLRENSSLFY